MKNNLDNIFSRQLESKQVPFRESSWDKMASILDDQKGSPITDEAQQPQPSHASDSDRKWIYLFLLLCVPILSVSILSNDDKVQPATLNSGVSSNLSDTKVLSDHSEKGNIQLAIEKNESVQNSSDKPYTGNLDNTIGNSRTSLGADGIINNKEGKGIKDNFYDASDDSFQPASFPLETNSFIPSITETGRIENDALPIAQVAMPTDIDRVLSGLLLYEREIQYEAQTEIIPVLDKKPTGLAYLSLIYNQNELGAGVGINVLRYKDLELSVGIQHMWRRNDPVLLAEKEIINFGVGSSSTNISYTVQDEHFISVPIYISYNYNRIRFLAGLETDYLLALRTELKEENESGTSLRSVWVDESSYRHLAFKLSGGIGWYLGKGLHADALVRVPIKSRYQLQEADFTTGVLSNKLSYTIRLTYDIFK